jgi:hypothetical protein
MLSTISSESFGINHVTGPGLHRVGGPLSSLGSSPPAIFGTSENPKKQTARESVRKGERAQHKMHDIPIMSAHVFSISHVSPVWMKRQGCLFYNPVIPFLIVH